MKIRTLLAGIALACAATGPAWAQSYPTRTVKIICPTPPGGPTDLIARVLGDKLSVMWGQQVIVENRGGAGHMIGTDAAAKSAPDGYTFVVVTTPHVTNPAMMGDKLTFDPVKDFTPISLAASLPLALVATPGVPFNNVKELIAHAKAKPGALRVATAGNGTGPHLAAALFQQLTGTDLQIVPYKGGPQATTAVMSGEVEVYFDSPAAALPQVKAGKVKGLATTGRARSPSAPEIPTMVESGIPGFVMESWYGLLAPAGLPADIVAKVNKDVAAVMAMPDVRGRLTASMFEPRGTSPQELAALIQSELPRWTKIIKDGNIRPQ